MQVSTFKSRFKNKCLVLWILNIIKIWKLVKVPWFLGSITSGLIATTFKCTIVNKSIRKFSHILRLDTVRLLFNFPQWLKTWSILYKNRSLLQKWVIYSERRQRYMLRISYNSTFYFFWFSYCILCRRLSFLSVWATWNLLASNGNWISLCQF